MFIGRGIFAILLGAILLSVGTAVFVATWRLLQADVVGRLAGVGLLGLLAYALWLAAKVPNRPSDRAYVIGWATVAIIARSLIWFMAPDYEQTGDCLFMRDSIRLLARNGFGDSTMLYLAGRYYDDYLWIGRSIPFLYPLAKLWPGHEVATARVLNMILSVLHNLMVYGLCKRTAGRREARIAYALVTLIPIHSWLILDYTHQYLGAFLVMAGICLLARAADRSEARPAVWIRDGLLFGLVLCALHVQSGIDKFMVVIALFSAAIWALAFGLRDARCARLLVALASAAVLFAPVSAAFTRWLNQYRPHRMSSHPISYTARGWNVVTWGEYYGVYEQIDRETPWPEKPDAMKALILSQIAHEPVKTLIALPLVKVAKYFLIGYATAIEQQLDGAGYGRMRQLFRGMRVAFAPAFLLLCAFGLWRMLRDESARDPLRTLAAGVPLIFCAVYVIAGETSPRYSFHVHGFLAILGSLTWAKSVPILSVRQTVARLAKWWSGSLLVLGLSALALPPLIRHVAGGQLYVNFRSQQDEMYRHELCEPTVFTEIIKCGEEKGSGLASALEVPADAKRVSFFLWPLDRKALHGARVVVTQGDQVLWECELESIPHILRVETQVVPAHAGALQLRVIGASCASNAPLVRWGYVRFSRL